MLEGPYAQPQASSPSITAAAVTNPWRIQIPSDNWAMLVHPLADPKSRPFEVRNGWYASPGRDKVRFAARINLNADDGGRPAPQKTGLRFGDYTTQFKRAIDMTDDELAAIASGATLHVVK